MNAAETELKQRWIFFAQQHTIPQPADLWKTIFSMHSEKGRYYHNLKHIHDCLNKLDQWKGSGVHCDPDDFVEIELALWFHDIIYDTHRADNEEASAALMTHELRVHPLEANAHQLILATQHSVPLKQMAEQIICDIDLSILGAQSADKYKQYARQIRQEYHWAPADQYCQGRIKVLDSFLNRPAIYQTEYAISRWEENARKNLTLEKRELEKGQLR